LLREALSRGADRVRLVVPEADAVTPDSAGAALAAALKADTHPDLVLGGAGEGDGEDGLAARLTAEALDVPFAGTAAQLAGDASASGGVVLLAEAEGRGRRARALPAAIGVRAGLPLRRFTIAGYLAGLAKTVETVRWPRKAPIRTEVFTEAAQVEGRSAAEETV